jgi:hypothetical protein
LAFSIVDRFCAALLYGRAGRFTAQNGDFRPGQSTTPAAVTSGAPHFLASVGHTVVLGPVGGGAVQQVRD